MAQIDPIGIDISTGQQKRLGSFNGMALGPNSYMAVISSTTPVDQVPTMTSNTTPSGVASASSEANGFNRAWHAFDKDSTSKWTSNATTTGFLRYDFGTYKIITRYIVTGPTSGQATKGPKTWTFEGSLDGITWDVLDTQTNVAAWSAVEQRSYDLTTYQAYRTYRMNITANQGDTNISIVALALHALPTTVFIDNRGNAVFSQITGAHFDDGSRTVNVKSQGAVGDGVVVTDAAITSGQNILTSATAGFTALDVGKPIVVKGATTEHSSLITTIAGYTNATTVTLTANASRTVTGAEARYGTDNSKAFLAAIARSVALGGAEITIPPGIYCVSADITHALGNIALTGAGMGLTTLMGLGNINLMKLDAALDTSVSDVTVRGITFDCGFVSQGLLMRNVANWLVENCEFKNTGMDSGLYFMLMFGSQVSTPALCANYYGREGIVRGCRFRDDFANNVEMINMGQGRDFLIEGCSFDNVTRNIGGAVYTWFAENVRIQNCVFRNDAHVAVNGRGPTLMEGCYFIDSHINTQSAQNLTVRGSCMTISEDDGDNRAELRIQGIFRTVGEAAWYFPYGPEPTKNIIIEGNLFLGTAESGVIGYPTFNDLSGNEFIGNESITLRGNVFWRNRWPNEIYARNLIVDGNYFIENNVGPPISSVHSGFYGGGEDVTFTDNTAFDYQVVAAPVTTPTLALNATAGNLNGAYNYRISYVTAAGETIGGLISSTLTVSNQQINLTGIPIGPVGTTARKIYRTAAGGLDGSQKLVATLADNTTTIYTDNVADGSLGAQVLTVTTASAVTQDYGAVFRNKLQEEGLVSSMTVRMSNNRMQGGIRYYYSGALQTAPSSAMVITGSNNTGVNQSGLYAAGNSGTSLTINRVNGDHQTVTMTGNCTFAITAGQIKGDIMTLELTQDATGSRVATWPSNFKKAGGTLTLTTTAAATDVINMRWDGVNWVELSRSMGVS